MPSGPLIHRYRYVAVTPGATIDWSLCTKRENDDDGSASMGGGNHTAATTPPGSDDEREEDDDDDGGGAAGGSTDGPSSSSPSSDGDGSGKVHLYADGGKDEDDDDDANEFQFPPVLFENPLPPQLTSMDAGESSMEADVAGWNDRKLAAAATSGDEEERHPQRHDEEPKPTHASPHRHHKRSHSLFDEHGNPVVLTATATANNPTAAPVSNPPNYYTGISAPPSSATSTASFMSVTTSASNAHQPAQILTWEEVSALPYRTRRLRDLIAVRNSDDDGNADVDIIDHWNVGEDPSFRDYWEFKRRERSKSTDSTSTSNPADLTAHNLLLSTTVTQRHDNDNDGDPISKPNEDDDPLDVDDQRQPQPQPQSQPQPRESVYIVCYHLPVILTRDPQTSAWTACWSESLIAKTETHGVSSTRKTRWIGTVSSIPAQYLLDPHEREAIRAVLRPMDCIPVFFVEEGDILPAVERAGATSASASTSTSVSTSVSTESILDLMYLGFCKQVLWPSFHNVDLLDLATNGWGQRQRKIRSDPVAACAMAAAEAHERKRSESIGAAGGPTSPDGRTRPPPPTASTAIHTENKALPNLQSDWDQSRLDSWWNAYKEVNRRFSQVVAQLVTGGDIVWVHDYHLALLPRMLREARGETEVVVGGRRTHSLSVVSVADAKEDAAPTVRPIKMVFFIHVPFPTSQVFRELERGEELLEGMLHADVVGFHAFDHARHFLNAAKRILGLTYESLVGGLIGVRHRGTKVLVTVSNVSIETDIIEALLAFPSVQEEAEALRKKHEGRSIIAGIAVAQRLSGVGLKLLAFERLLTDYPVWQSKVVMLQRCLIAGTRRVDEAETLREVRALVQRIRFKFGPQVINYEEQVGSVLPIDQRLAIWSASHVMMHTPIREGLNLCPLEYVFARKEPADPGVVIASEFSAVSSILNGALRVNPFDIQMCVTSIDCALSMSPNERDARRGRDIDFVSTCPSGLWTRNVLRDLSDTMLESKKLDGVGENSPESILAREIELGLERLDLGALISAYEESKNRVIIIDFNGTLVAKEPSGKYLKREILGTSGYKPPQSAMLALCRLCADPRNTVYVVSGDSMQNLEFAVGNIPGLGLAASNGGCFADPIKHGTRLWKYLDFGVDWEAVKKVAMPIISKYTARTNGSFVKLTHSSIGWSYYSCDPEWGSLQASYLVPELEAALNAFDVRFVALKGIVEVVPRKLHKGHIVAKILDDTRAHKGNGNGVDFALCMGDDISDEKMFTSVISFEAESDCPNSYAFNVAVGKKPTHASFFVDDASDVADVLVALSGGADSIDPNNAPDNSFQFFS